MTDRFASAALPARILPVGQAAIDRWVRQTDILKISSKLRISE
jgi:hypothetical protein